MSTPVAITTEIAIVAPPSVNVVCFVVSSMYDEKPKIKKSMTYLVSSVLCLTRSTFLRVHSCVAHGFLTKSRRPKLNVSSSPSFLSVAHGDSGAAAILLCQIATMEATHYSSQSKKVTKFAFLS